MSARAWQAGDVVLRNTWAIAFLTTVDEPWDVLEASPAGRRVQVRCRRTGRVDELTGRSVSRLQPPTSGWEARLADDGVRAVAFAALADLRGHLYSSDRLLALSGADARRLADALTAARDLARELRVLP